MLHSSSAAGILVVDSADNITSLTAEAERTLQLAQHKKPLTLASLPAPLQTIIREVRKSGCSVVNQRVVLQVRDTTPITATINASQSIAIPIPNVVMVIKVDTSAAQMEHNLRRLDRLASVGTLAASMAHEIKNALVAIRTFTELLLEKNPDAELAGIVRREVGRVDSIVTQMLRFAAPAQPKFSAIRLHRLLEHSVRLVQHGNANKEIRFHTELNATPDSLTGDDHLLEQAFVNLLLNAVESMSNAGSLTVSTTLVAGDSPALREEEHPRRWIEIRISDTGAGIPGEKLDRIFEPFFTTKQRGTGLGLAVTQRIIREHHGSIRVESSLGKGTTFIVLLAADAHD